MKHIIYKITNTINGRYYIGRHSTKNVDDGYMGSGIGIKNAIQKYGKENFTKEILAEASTRKKLWKLESQYVNEDIVNDEKSYNMSVGGKHYLQGLTAEQLRNHQSKAGKRGASSFRKQLKTLGKLTEWHSKGGKAAVELRYKKYNYKIVTHNGEVLIVNANDFKQICNSRGWNYNTLAWKIVEGPKTIKRGPLKGFYIEQMVIND
jgi:hypothetical protein